MKYFKLELLARCRSLDNEAADAAAAEWEEVIVAYRKRLEVIRADLPAGARGLLSRVSLHDAKVLALVAARSQPWFSILIRLEGTPSQPGEMLELSYRIAAGPRGGASLTKSASSGRNGSGLWILYDEFELDRRRNVCTHSLLLTDGSEIAIRFHNLRVRRLSEVILPPFELPAGETTWPLVEA